MHPELIEICFEINNKLIYLKLIDEFDFNVVWFQGIEYMLEKSLNFWQLMDSYVELWNVHINCENLITLILRILNFENREHNKFKFNWSISYRNNNF